MKHKKSGALILSFALTFAVAVPVTVGAVYAAGSSEGATYSTADLEQHYTDLISGSEILNPTKTDGKYYGSYNVRWSDLDINPAYDNVTVQYDFTRTYNKNIPFGFRFTLGDKHCALYRNQMSLSLARGDDREGDIKVKVFGADYYSHVETDNNGNGTTDALISFANTNEYGTLSEPSGSGFAGDEIIKSGALFRTYFATQRKDGDKLTQYSDTSKSLLPWTVTLKKVTTDEGVLFRYYENGNYYCTLQFEEEVTAYAPNIAQYDSNSKLDNFSVKLGEKYTEYDEAMDQATGERKVSLAVGEEMEVDYYRTVWDVVNASYPSLQFVYGNEADGAGVTLERFASRIAFRSMSKQSVYSGTRNVYIDTKSAGTGTVSFNSGAKVYEITQAENNITNTKYGDGKNLNNDDNYLIKYKVVRRADITFEENTYALYSFYENGYYVADIGFPEEAGEISIRPAVAYSGGTTLVKNLKTTALETLKAQAAANPDNAKEGAVALDKMAGVKKASVRFMADTQGLRFGAKLSQDVVQYYKSAYGENNVTFGVKLVRADGAYAYIEAVNRTFSAGAYAFNGVVTNIAEANYGVKYTPYVYIRYVDSENAEHYVLYI